MLVVVSILGRFCHDVDRLVIRQEATIKKLLHTLHATVGAIAAADCVSSASDPIKRRARSQRTLAFLRAERLTVHIHIMLLTKLKECAAGCRSHHVHNVWFAGTL